MNVSFPPHLRTRTAAIISILVVLAAMEGLYLFSELHYVGALGFGLDDSWIHATYARNLANGKGFCFNLGEPMAASSAPLYTLILALAFRLFGHIIWCAKLLGIAGYAASCLLLYIGTEHLTGNRFTAWMTALFCAVSPLLLWSSVNGMELGLYLISPCAALYFYSRQRYLLMTVLLALGVWFRPEALLLLGLGWLAIPLRRKLWALAAGAVIVLGYFAFNYSLNGTIVPLTVIVKSGTYGERFGSHFLIETIPFFWNLNFPLLVVFVPFGIWYLWRKAWWVAVFPFAFYLFYWASSYTAASLWRYLHPMLPFLYLLVTSGALGVSLWKPKWAQPARILLIALLLIQSYIGIKDAWINGRSTKNITEMQVFAAQLAGTVTNPSEVVAVNDIGAMGYYSGRYVLDLMGLVTPLRSLEENLSLGNPALVVMFDSWFPDRLKSPTFVEKYLFLAKIPLPDNMICADSVMTVYARKDRFSDMRSRAAAAFK